MIKITTVILRYIKLVHNIYTLASYMCVHCHIFKTYKIYYKILIYLMSVDIIKTF